jgi:hypothetical protein
VNLGFDPAAGITEAPVPIAVDVVVDAGATDLRGFSIVIRFDETVAEIDTIFAGPQLTGAACPHFFYVFHAAGDDSLRIDAATLGCSSDGPGVLATIVFRGLEHDLEDYPLITPLTWGEVILRDSANAALPAICNPGQLTFIGPVPVDVPEAGFVPTSWAGAKVAYRVREDVP